MGCCGRTRANLAHAYGSATPPPGSPATRTSACASASEATLRDMQAARAAGTPVMLRYVGRSAISVRGPATGQRYAFPSNAVHAVDVRDAAVLLRTTYFRAA